MPLRLVALDEGPDIPLDRDMLIVGRHPQCDARLDSIRVSRRHCCMTQDRDHGEVVIRDLGSTNGIRINGQRVEKGRLKQGDELSIAHIRFRVDDGSGQEMTLAEPLGERLGIVKGIGAFKAPARANLAAAAVLPDSPLAVAVRDMLPAGVGDKCRIQVIVQMNPAEGSSAGSAAEGGPDLCPPDSSP